MQQGAEIRDTAGAKIAETDKAGYWVNRAFLSGATIAAGLLVSFGLWIGSSLMQIKESTSVMASEFTATKRDITELKSSVFSLSLRGESWATKPELANTKEVLMDQIHQLRAQVNSLEIRVQNLSPQAKPR